MEEDQSLHYLVRWCPAIKFPQDCAQLTTRELRALRRGYQVRVRQSNTSRSSIFRTGFFVLLQICLSKEQMIGMKKSKIIFTVCSMYNLYVHLCKYFNPICICVFNSIPLHSYLLQSIVQFIFLNYFISNPELEGVRFANSCKLLKIAHSSRIPTTMY